MTILTGESVEFSCSHSGIVPNNMGRGVARTKRIAAHFNRPCYDCAVKNLTKHAGEYTRIIGKNEVTGKFITRLYNANEQADYVKKHMPSSY